MTAGEYIPDYVPRSLAEEIFDRLPELPGRLLWCTLAVIVGTLIAGAFSRDAMQLLIEPLYEAYPYLHPRNSIFTILIGN